MNKVTYRELIERLKGLTEEQLDMDLTIWNREEDECFPSNFLVINHESLDDDHPVLYYKE